MIDKTETAGSDATKSSALPIFQLGANGTEAMLNMHKEMIAACEEASHSWMERARSEIELWSELAAKLSASKSVPDSVDAYRDTVARRMQLAAEDGQRLFENGQKIINAMTRSMAA